MTDAPLPDPFAHAKDNLRDTIKWLVTTFSALAAIVVAGVSFTGLSSLDGLRLVFAVVAVSVGLSCLLAAIGVTLKLLTAEAFYFSDLTGDLDLRATLDAHACDILTPNFPTIETLIDARAKTILDIESAKGDPGGTTLQAAVDAYSQLIPHVSRVTNLGQFLLMRRALDRSLPRLRGLSIVALISLGVFSVLSGAKLEPDGPEVSLDPGRNFGAVASALTQACGDKALLATVGGKAPLSHWVKLKIAAPNVCAGLDIALPAKLAATFPVERPAAVR